MFLRVSQFQSINTAPRGCLAAPAGPTISHTRTAVLTDVCPLHRPLSSHTLSSAALQKISTLHSCHPDCPCSLLPRFPNPIPTVLTTCIRPYLSRPSPFALIAPLLSSCKVALHVRACAEAYSASHAPPGRPRPPVVVVEDIEARFEPDAHRLGRVALLALVGEALAVGKARGELLRLLKGHHL